MQKDSSKTNSNNCSMDFKSNQLSPIEEILEDSRASKTNSLESQKILSSKKEDLEPWSIKCICGVNEVSVIYPH